MIHFIGAALPPPPAPSKYFFFLCLLRLFAARLSCAPSLFHCFLFVCIVSFVVVTFCVPVPFVLVVLVVLVVLAVLAVLLSPCLPWCLNALLHSHPFTLAIARFVHGDQSLPCFPCLPCLPCFPSAFSSTAFSPDVPHSTIRNPQSEIPSLPGPHPLQYHLPTGHGHFLFPGPLLLHSPRARRHPHRLPGHQMPDFTPRPGIHHSPRSRAHHPPPITPPCQGRPRPHAPDWPVL